MGGGEGRKWEGLGWRGAEREGEAGGLKHLLQSYVLNKTQNGKD